MGAVRALRRKMLFFFREPAMSKPLLSPQGDFPAVGLGRRLAAMFYDFLLCTALLIVTAFVYKLVWIAFVGEAKMRNSHRIRRAGRRPAAVDDSVLRAVWLLRQVLDPFRADPGHAGVGRARTERRRLADQPVAGAVALCGVDCIVVVRGAGFYLVTVRQAETQLA